MKASLTVYFEDPFWVGVFERMEEKNGEDRTKVFETAKMRLEEYLASQGIRHVAISMSEDLPQQDPNSGKFKHVVNMQRNL